MFTAIKNNNVKEVIKLAPKDWNTRYRGMTPLCYACKWYRNKCIAILAPYGNINEIDDNGHSPLSHIVHHNQEVEVELLLNLGADPNIGNSLYFATEYQNVRIVTLLLEYGDDPNKKTIHRPLDIAIEKQNVEIVSLLLKHGADPNKKTNQQPLDKAIKYQNALLIELLLQYDATVKKKSVLNTLIDYNNINIIHLLLQYNYQFNYKTLHYAINESNKLMVKLLLDNNASSIDKKGNNAIHRACKYNDINMVRLVLTYNFDVNELNDKGRSPIFFVFDEEILELLISKGNTALHDAIKNNLFSLTKLLLSLGADPLITNNKGFTAKEMVDHRNPEYTDSDFSDDDWNTDKPTDASTRFKELISSYEFCPIKEVGYD
jgi:ankyrin repeat protein